MKDHRHVLGRLAELMTVLERNRKVASDAMERLAASDRDDEAVSEVIAMMEEMNDELGEAQDMSQTILETLNEEIPEEGLDGEGEDPK